MQYLLHAHLYTRVCVFSIFMYFLTCTFCILTSLQMWDNLKYLQSLKYNKNNNSDSNSKSIVVVVTTWSALVYKKESKDYWIDT